uniref:Uncharacterized protein n=1 Tax=Meloidogyne incognita TaxID=6306 RepID=A0A914MBC3_MELIC
MYESSREPESSATSSQVLVQKKKYIFVWELDNWVFLDKYHSQFLQIWDKLQRPLNLLLRNLFGISNFKSFNFSNILDVSTLENIGFRIPHSSLSNVNQGGLNTSSNLRYMTEKLKQIQALYKYFKKLSLFEGCL